MEMSVSYLLRKLVVELGPCLKAFLKAYDKNVSVSDRMAEKVAKMLRR